MSQEIKLLTEQEWQDWQAHPGTRVLRHVLLSWKEQVKEQWAAGSFTDMSQFGTAILNAKAIGAVQLIDQIMGLEYDRIVGEVADE
jgi:hypothetical protein